MRKGLLGKQGGTPVLLTPLRPHCKLEIMGKPAGSTPETSPDRIRSICLSRPRIGRFRYARQAHMYPSVSGQHEHGNRVVSGTMSAPMWHCSPHPRSALGGTSLRNRRNTNIISHRRLDSVMKFLARGNLLFL